MPSSVLPPNYRCISYLPEYTDQIRHVYASADNDLTPPETHEFNYRESFSGIDYELFKLQKDSIEDTLTLIADDQSKIIGFSNFVFIDDGGYIDYVYVLGEHQGQGIGKYLLTSTMSKILSKYPNSNNIMLSTQRNNKAAMQLYYNIGFRAFYYEMKFQLYRCI